MKPTYSIRLSLCRLAVLDLVKCNYRGGSYLITRINVPREYRGRGYGRALLEQVTEDADYQHARLILEIHPSGDLDYDALEAWYGRYGFYQHEDDELGTIYIREPYEFTQRQIVREGVSGKLPPSVPRPTTGTTLHTPVQRVEHPRPRLADTEA